MKARIAFASGNKKTGPIPVSLTERASCPSSCPLAGRGCYAENFPLSKHWRRLAKSARADWSDFIARVKRLPRGQLWRHNQAGDLPGRGNRIAMKLLGELVRANRGKRGFTFTRKPLTPTNARAIALANAAGFVINVSADNPAHADELVDAGVGPVVTVLPASARGNLELYTPAGRRIVVCPEAYVEDVTCARCQLCAWRDRKVIIGFPVHGAKRKAAAKATGNAA